MSLNAAGSRFGRSLTSAGRRGRGEPDATSPAGDYRVVALSQAWRSAGR